MDIAVNNGDHFLWWLSIAVFDERRVWRIVPTENTILAMVHHGFPHAKIAFESIHPIFFQTEPEIISHIRLVSYSQIYHHKYIYIYIWIYTYEYIYIYVQMVFPLNIPCQSSLPTGSWRHRRRGSLRIGKQAMEWCTERGRKGRNQEAQEKLGEYSGISDCNSC